MLCSNRSVSCWDSEEGLGLSEQHCSLVAAAGTNTAGHPRLRDQILSEGTVTFADRQVLSRI